MVTIEIVINSTRLMGIRVAISCQYCIAVEVMLLFSSLKKIFCHAPCLVHCEIDGCIVQTCIALPFIGLF